MNLLDRPCWVFDLDGTLTVAKHDFDDFRARLGLPAGRGILESIRDLPPDARERVLEAVAEWENEVAERAEAAPDTRPLLEELRRRDAKLGILTRNTRQAAVVTLEGSGLMEFFPHCWILGRHDAAAKPAPDGVLFLMRAWTAEAAQMVMVGDFRHDIAAGNAAGAATVLIDRGDRFAQAHQATVRVRALTELLDG